MIAQSQIYNASYINRRFPIKYYLYSYAAQRDQRCERADLQDRNTDRNCCSLVPLARAFITDCLLPAHYSLLILYCLSILC